MQRQRTYRKKSEERSDTTNSDVNTITSTKTNTNIKLDDMNLFTESINVIVRCRGRGFIENESKSPTVINIEDSKPDEVKISLPEHINESNNINNNNNNNAPTDNLAEIANIDNSTTRTYKLDQVYGPATDQMTFFQRVGEGICEDFLKGFNCTIFAYGQTGAGKTYTMSGKVNGNYLTPDSGIIPRCLKKMFDSDLGNVFLKCSFVEIYNEVLKDLLSDGKNDKLLKIYEGQNKMMKIKGLEEFYIKDFEEAMRLFKVGLERKKVAATKMNLSSSRSHTIFTIHLMKKRPNETEYQFAKLNLVDLAGSENINRSGSTNQRAKEAGSINQSLLTLGRVINSLVDGSKFIPYRESKLTRLLQDSLGGKTKTVLVANIAPTLIDAQASMSTLEYASKAKNIQNSAQIVSSISEEFIVNDLIEENRKLKLDLIATRRRENCIVMDDSNYKELYLTQKTLKDEVVELRGFRLSLMNQLEHQMKKLDYEKNEKQVLSQNIESLEAKIVELENKFKKQHDNETLMKQKCHLLYSEYNKNLAMVFDTQMRTKSVLSDRILGCLADIDNQISTETMRDPQFFKIKSDLEDVTNNIGQLGEIDSKLTEKIEKSRNNLKNLEESITFSTSGILNQVNQYTIEIEKHQNDNLEFQDFVRGFFKDRDSGLLNEVEAEFESKLDTFKNEINKQIGKLVNENMNVTYSRFLEHYQNKISEPEKKWSKQTSAVVKTTKECKSNLDSMILKQQNEFNRLVRNCVNELENDEMLQLKEKVQSLDADFKPILNDIVKIEETNLLKDERYSDNIEFIKNNISELKDVINEVVSDNNLNFEDKKEEILTQMKDILSNSNAEMVTDKGNENVNILQTPKKNKMNTLNVSTTSMKSPIFSPSKSPFRSPFRSPMRKELSPVKSMRSSMSPRKDVAFGLKRSSSTDFGENVKRRM